MRPAPVSPRAAVTLAALVVSASAATVLPAAAHVTSHPVGHWGEALVTPHRAIATVGDPRGDVRTKVGDLLNDVDNSGDGFKPGRGANVAPNAADQAIDLSKVVYRITYGAAQPTLTITYRAQGPFTLQEHVSFADDTFTERLDVDAVETFFDHGRYALVMAKSRRDQGLFHGRRQDRRVKCPGIRSNMKEGGHVATQTVPLSCLTDLGIKATAFRSRAVHIAINYQHHHHDGDTYTGDVTADGNPLGRFAYDNTGRTPRLPLAGPAN